MTHDDEHVMDDVCMGSRILECQECDHYRLCPGCEECAGENDLRRAAAMHVARWAYYHDVPADVHDAAAFALDEPSLAHGFYPGRTNATSKENHE